MTCHERLVEARGIAADLQVEFSKASDAANRAVMADTDERAVSAAADARRAFDALQKDNDALAPVLERLEYADERKILEQFKSQLAEYRALEEIILDLAVGSAIGARTTRHEDYDNLPNLSTASRDVPLASPRLRVPPR